MVVSAKRFEQLALEEPDRNWELDHGRLRGKPLMSAAHGWLMFKLGHMLQLQLDWNVFQVRVNGTHLHRPAETYYIPDVTVIPTEWVLPLLDRPGLEVHDMPMPLVVEFWSPSTSRYDVDAKIPEYQRRGDREIWRIHPYERTLTCWRKQADGSYTQTLYREGVIEPVALPNVKIDLATFFAEWRSSRESV